MIITDFILRQLTENKTIFPENKIYLTQNKEKPVLISDFCYLIKKDL